VPGGGGGPRAAARRARAADDALRSGRPEQPKADARWHLDVGIGPGGIGALTWPALHELARRRPEVDVAVTTLTFRTALPALSDGRVGAVLLHGPVGPRPGRRVVTVGRTPIDVVVPSADPMARARRLSMSEVLGRLSVVPAEEMGQEWCRFWSAADYRGARRPTTYLVGDGMAEVIDQLSRRQVLGLWPRDVGVPAEAGLVVRPLVDGPEAPLQVVADAADPLADELVAACLDAARNVGGPPLITGSDHDGVPAPAPGP
jgi:DNA-binding transcriptional LysR family regulator